VEEEKGIGDDLPSPKAPATASGVSPVNTSAWKEGRKMVVGWLDNPFWEYIP
jgi:hypothetical protein